MRRSHATGNGHYRPAVADYDDNIRQENVTSRAGLKAVFLVTSVLGPTGLWIAIWPNTKEPSVLVLTRCAAPVAVQPGTRGA